MQTKQASCREKKKTFSIGKNHKQMDLLKKNAEKSRSLFYTFNIYFIVYHLNLLRLKIVFFLNLLFAMAFLPNAFGCYFFFFF